MKKLFYFTPILLIALFLFYKKYKSRDHKVVNLSIPNEVKTFDPAQAFDDTSLNILGQSLDTLYQYHYLKRPYEVIPSLAEEMPLILNNGKTYIIKIKKNVQYHHHKSFKNKRFVKAQDFVLGIKRLYFKPLNSVGRFIFDKKIIGLEKFQAKVGDDFQKMLNTPIEGLFALDDHTLKIELTRADPNIIYYLSMYFTAPVPKELLIYLQNNLSSTLIGTGAFVFKDHIQNVYHFEKFDNYRFESYPSVGDRYANTKKLLRASRKKIPFVDELNFYIIENEDEKWDLFLKGKIDLINTPVKYLSKVSRQDSELLDLFSKKNIEVKFFSKIASRWLGFNMQDPLIGKSLYLRKAIAHAIDFEKYLEVIGNNINLKANSILHPSIKGYRPTHSNNFNYNLSLAKDFLRKAGYPEAKGLPTLILSTRGNTKQTLDEANFIKEQLEKIGLRIALEVLTFSEFIKRGRQGKLKHLWIDNWIYDYPDAENILQLLISKNIPGVNKSGFSDDQVDSLYKNLVNTLDSNERLKIIYQIENIVYEKLPWVMMMYESSYLLKSKSLKNFRKSYFIKNNIKYLNKN